MSLVIIRPSIFSVHPAIRAGVSTRAGGVSPDPLGLNLSFSVGDERGNVEQNRSLFFENLGIDPGTVAYPGQIHGSTILYPASAGRLESCDGLVTDRADLYLAVSIADCLPILLFDPVAKCLAAVHSGWRGSVLRILQVAVNELTGRFGSLPSDILAYLGPSAGACCYEVGEEVARQFPEEFVARQIDSNPHLDLRGFNRGLLVEAGLRPEVIEVSRSCTICDSSFHSYRRDGARSGRMLAVIGMRSTEL